MGEAFYVIFIEIHRERKQRIFILSQTAYIERVSERFSTKNCKSHVASIIKHDKFHNG